MANRLSVIATRTGDGGDTGLADGTRLRKSAARIHALGSVDELNSVIGLLRTERLPAEVETDLNQIQHDLFDLGAELAMPGQSVVQTQAVAQLDARLAAYNAELPPLREFILPGGHRAAAQAHMARAICRRAERDLVGLPEDAAASEAARQYLNRLSDLLFIMTRVINRHHGVPDVYWQSHAARKTD